MLRSQKNGFPWLLLLSILMVSACSMVTAPRPTLVSQQGTPSPFLPTVTPMPTITPTPPPLGSSANPLVIGVISPNPSQSQMTALQTLSDLLSEALAIEVTHTIFPTYLDLETELQKKLVHLVWLQPVEYLLASEKELVTAQLVANHLGITAYGIQFIGHQDSNFKLYFDVGNNQSTASAATALSQLAGLRPCLTSENSLAGYWLPLGYLEQANIQVQEPIQTYSYSASLRALYIKGVCSFSATYAISGDPRSSSEVITDLPDVMSRLPVLWVSPPIIPSLNFSISPDLPLPLINQLTDFLLQYSRTDTGKLVLTDTNQYAIEALEPIQDSAYEELRNLLSIQDVRLPNILNSNNQPK